jgi:hypothetical protein
MWKVQNEMGFIRHGADESLAESSRTLQVIESVRWVNLRGEVEHVYPDTFRVWLTPKCDKCKHIPSDEIEHKPPSADRDLHAIYGEEINGL